MTAEAAVVLPVLVGCVAALLWALGAATARIQCLDAAQAGARAVARSEPEAVAVGVARQAAPAGARVAVRRVGDLWRVRVEAASPGPGPLGVTVHGEASALAEDVVGAEP
ncbi:TadE family type IV pilus minor pilin [Streptomyces sp. NPDC001941]|uniref:TadE family type IV pilus minor pilin n=1 Tax=Streptomyces sp. NPDC001941 TaxID=3154659 RepID=UPI00331EDA39